MEFFCAMKDYYEDSGALTFSVTFRLGGLGDLAGLFTTCLIAHVSFHLLDFIVGSQTSRINQRSR